MTTRDIISSCNTVSEIISDTIGGKSGTEHMFEILLSSSPIEFLYEIGYKPGFEDLLIIYRDDVPDRFIVIDAYSDLVKYISSMNMTAENIVNTQAKTRKILDMIKSESFVMNYYKYFNELTVQKLMDLIVSPSEKRLEIGDEFDMELDFSKLFTQA